MRGSSAVITSMAECKRALMQLEKADGRIEGEIVGAPAGCSVSDDQILFHPLQYNANNQLVQSSNNAFQPVCKTQHSCGRVVFQGKGSDSGKGYVFDFGGTNGKSSIYRAHLANGVITSKMVKNTADIPGFNACVSPNQPFPFWVRVDTFGHAAMGKGGKVGQNTLLQWKDHLYYA